MVKTRLRLSFWQKFISIVIVGVLMDTFVVPVFSQSFFNNVSDQVHPWTIILSEALGLILSLVLVKQLIEFSAKDGDSIGKALVVLNIIIPLVSFFLVKNVFSNISISISMTNLGLDILRLIISSLITYYACVFFLSESRKS